MDLLYTLVLKHDKIVSLNCTKNKIEAEEITNVFLFDL